MLNRRGFLAALAGGAAVAADPERLLWRPGAKVYSLPPLYRAPAIEPVITSGVQLREFFRVGDVFTIAGDTTPYIVTGFDGGMSFRKVEINDIRPLVAQIASGARDTLTVRRPPRYVTRVGLLPGFREPRGDD